MGLEDLINAQFEAERAREAEAARHLKVTKGIEKAAEVSAGQIHQGAAIS